MQIPITKKRLVDWAGAQTLRDAESLVERGLVLEAEYDPPLIKGAILWNNRTLTTSLKLHEDGTVESLCPCYANRERGLICAHVIALGLTLVRRATDPERDAKYREELRRASRLESVDDAAYIQRATPGTPGALPARIVVTLPPDWPQAYRKGRVTVDCTA